MATFQKQAFSGSTDGRPVKVVATATAGTTIHTATAATDEGSYDEIWMWANNSDTVDRKLTIEFGGTTAPDDLIEYTVPAEDGLKLIVPGCVLQNSLVVKAFAAAANVVTMHGYVNRITV